MDRRDLAPYSRCYQYFLPFSLCNLWRAEGGETGRFEAIYGARCQYKGVVLDILAAALEEEEETVVERISKRKEEAGDDGAIYDFLVKKTRWAGCHMRATRSHTRATRSRRAAAPHATTNRLEAIS